MIVVKRIMSDRDLKFIDVIPSKETITPGTSLNVLGGVINPGEAGSAKIILWGKAENIWKPLLSQEVFLEEKGHRHLYLTIPPEIFQEEYWGIKNLEEIELLISDITPENGTPGKLVFIESTSVSDPW